jgi:sugar phosphate permease
MSPASPQPTRVRWLIFSLACGTSWLLYLHRYTFNFIKPELAREYGYSETQLGSLFSLFYITYGAGQVPSGLVCDLSGSRLFLASIIVLWSAALAGFGATGDLKILALFRLLFGGAQAGAYPALAKVSRTWFPRPVRTTLQGIVATTCGRLGGALSPIVMATLLMGVVGLSWRVALLVMAGAGAVFALAFGTLFRDTPGGDSRVNQAERLLIAEGEIPITGARAKLPWREALRSPSLAMLSVQQALAAGADVIYVSLMGSFFLDRFGVNLGSAGLLASLPLIGGALGGLAGGLLNDAACRWLGPRWGRSAVGFVGPLLASLVMLAVIRQQTALTAGIGLFTVKFFVDWNQPTVWGAASDLGGRFTGTAFAVVNSAGTVTSVLCPPLFGLILDASSSQQVVSGEVVRTTSYGPLFATIAGIYLASAVTWLAIDCRQRLDVEAS